MPDQSGLVSHRNGRLLAAVGAAVGLLIVAGCNIGHTPTFGGGHGGTGPSQSQTGGRSTLNWQSCSNGGTVASLRCGRIQVPVNYADPSGRKITLALTEVPATAPASQQQG